MAEQSPAFDALKRDIADAIQHHGKWLNDNQVVTALEEALADAWEQACEPQPRGLWRAAPCLLDALKAVIADDEFCELLTAERAEQVREVLAKVESRQ